MSMTDFESNILYFLYHTNYSLERHAADARLSRILLERLVTKLIGVKAAITVHDEYAAFANTSADENMADFENSLYSNLKNSAKC